MSPVPVVTTDVSPLAISASTELPMSLRAIAAPTDRETPAVPPRPAEIATAPANALIRETSDASTEIFAAEIPAVPSPLMVANASMSMRFST